MNRTLSGAALWAVQTVGTVGRRWERWVMRDIGWRSYFGLGTICVLVLLNGSSATANVWFHAQRNGSPADTGFQDFLDEAGTTVEENFENPELGPLLTPIGSLTLEPYQVELSGTWGGEMYEPPRLVVSREFRYPGQLYNRVVIPGIQFTLSFGGEFMPGAAGLWLFDDGAVGDSVYLVEVIEADGGYATFVFGNEIPLDAKGHELEGFVGAVSDVGIVEMTVTAIRSDTLEPFFDFFEADHLVFGTPIPVRTPEEHPGVGQGWVDQFGPFPGNSEQALEGNDSWQGRSERAENKDTGPPNKDEFGDEEPDDRVTPAKPTGPAPSKGGNGRETPRK